MNVGFLGFGEAASSIAIGLVEAGIEGIFAYDVMTGPKLMERLRKVNCTGICTLEELGQCEVVFSAVTASTAVMAAESLAEYIRPSTIYADINSCSPTTKARVSEVISSAGGLFVGVAVMSPIPPLKHKAPMLVDGPGAEQLSRLVVPYGMDIDVIDGPVGSAAAIKMFRSAIVKGIEALALEALVPARRMGVDDKVLESLEHSYGEMNISDLAKYLLVRHATHAERRAHELDEAADTISEGGLEPFATRGGAMRLAWSAGHGVSSKIAQLPESYTEVLDMFLDN